MRLVHKCIHVHVCADLVHKHTGGCIRVCADQVHACIHVCVCAGQVHACTGEYILVGVPNTVVFAFLHKSCLCTIVCRELH